MLRHQHLANRLNRRAQTEAENQRLNEMELSYQPLFWVVIALCLLAFFLGAR